jgi:hypothetical protein
VYQAIVKTTEGMLGFYSYMFGTAEAREAFVKRPDVWWYVFGEDDDWSWRPGGAQRPVKDLELPLFEPPELPGGIPQGILVEPRPRVTEYTGKLELEEDDDDDRW